MIIKRLPAYRRDKMLMCPLSSLLDGGLQPQS
jgi:hypothetical protein